MRAHEILACTVAFLVSLANQSAHAFGTYNEKINTQMAKDGFKKITNYCEMTVMGGQGAHGNLELEVREFTNASGNSMSVVTYVINDTANEHYDYTEMIPLKIGSAMRSIDVAGTRVERLLEKPKHVRKANTQGVLLGLLATLSNEGGVTNVLMRIEKVNLNKSTHSYNVNSDTYVECEEEL